MRTGPRVHRLHPAVGGSPVPNPLAVAWLRHVPILAGAPAFKTRWAAAGHHQGMPFETKIAVVVREDLAVWQKLNIVAFLSSAVAGGGREACRRRSVSLMRTGQAPATCPCSASPCSSTPATAPRSLGHMAGC